LRVALSVKLYYVILYDVTCLTSAQKLTGSKLRQL